MVKRYFRPFICAVCTAMSVICGCSPMFSVYVSAAEVTDGAETAVNEESEADAEETEPQTQAESESETETESEKQTESESETESEKQTESETETGSEKQTETEKQTESETEKNNIAKAVMVLMNQSSDVLTPADEFSQTVSVSYKDAVDSKITYNVDSSLVVKKLNVGSNTYLEGGKAIITSDSGETEVPITAEMDLSGYQNVTKIVFTPKIQSYSGMEAKFTAVLKMKDDAVEKGTTEATCSTMVSVTKDKDSAEFTESLTSKFESASLAKPSLSLTYDGKEYKDTVSGAIEYDKDFDLNLGSLSAKIYGKSSDFVYKVATPSFVTLKEIQVPEIKGAAKVKVTAVINDKDTDLGEAEPGGKISIDKSGVTEVKFTITPEGNIIETANAGKLVFANNIKKNKGTNNAGFTANANIEINGKEYSSNSNIISVNVKSRKIDTPETQPPQTNDNTGGNTGGNSGGNTGGNTSGGDQKQTEPQTETETENPNDEARKKEETERKEKTKKEAIQNEQEMKNKQNSILAARLSKLQAQSGSSGSGSTSTVKASKKDTTSTDKKYADWKVKPIDDSIIADFVPKEIAPILENIISNLVPGANEVQETAEQVTTETVETETETKAAKESKKKSEKKTDDKKSKSEKKDSSKKKK